jgi:flagellar biosynthetic protein FlhB
MPNDPSKTEQPTQKRIDDARGEGKVITSQDVSSLVGMVGAVGFLLYLVPVTASRAGSLFGLIARIDCGRYWTLSEIHGGLRAGLGWLALLLAPLLIGCVVLAIVARVAQTGPYFEPKALAWKLTALDPANGAKQMLPSTDNLVKLLLVLTKISAIALLAWIYIRRDLPAISQLPLRPLADGLAWSFGRAVMLLLRVLGLFILITAVDYVLKRRKYFDELMMSRQEIKDEMRDSEGDPHVRGRQRQRMRELTRLRLIAEVPKADVVVVNPTHVAVALRYEPGSWAPRIVAKGLRKRALRIRQIAEAAGVPIVREPVTARALYREGKAGQCIPEHLFGAVAAILAQLERLGLRSFSAAAPAAATGKSGVTA